MIVASSSWIIDGNSTRSLEIRFAKADLVLYFNYPRWLCYFRIFKRLFYKNPELNDRAYGCYEQITWSLIRYMWSFENRVVDTIKMLKEKYPQTTFIEIKNDKELGKLKELIIS